MKTLKIIFAIIFLTANYIYAGGQTDIAKANDIQLPLNLLPKGFEKISLGMPHKEFIKLRKKAKEGDELDWVWDLFEGVEKNEKKSKLTNSNPMYNEKIKGTFFNRVSYDFDNYKLGEVLFYYVSKNIKKVLWRRKKILEELIRIFGVPDELMVAKTIESVFKKPFWYARLIWNFKNGQIQFWCPQNIEKDIIKSNIDPLFWIMGFGIELRLRIMDLKNMQISKQYQATNTQPDRPIIIKDLKTADKEIQQVFKDIELNKIINEIKEHKDKER